MTTPHRARSTLLLPTLLLAAAAPAQVPGITREQMWFAPTAEDWKKPVQVTFQRSWNDALALAKEQKRAILVCVNMDGEIASEHYAGVRYRQPDIAALYEPYVCVIASVYRHNPRDYDEQGRRVLCPRFGCVTCGEHIAIEPIVYEKFLDGRRIAPRHIMVELDGTEVYDVFYAFDTDSVFKAIKEGISKRAIQAEPVVRGDRSMVERVASPDVRDRDAVEQAFAQGDAALRDALLAAASERGEQAPVDLLRLPLFGLDVERAQRARDALTKATAPGTVDLLAEALRVPMAEAERQKLVAALRRLGANSPQARTLAAVHEGLAGTAGGVDVARWSAALTQNAPAAAPDSYAIEAELQQKEQARRAAPPDAAQSLAIAESTLALARHYEPAVNEGRRDAARHVRLVYEDAQRAALAAEQRGVADLASGNFRVHAVLAACAWNLHDRDTAHRHAEIASKLQPDAADGYAAMAVMQIFADLRQRAIVDAIRQKREWPPEWLTDVHTAYSVLARHPLGQDFHVADHYDFVKALGGRGQATQTLDAGLLRFPDSALLHERLRARLLEEKGAEGLEAFYLKRLQEAASPTAAWYAGYATLVVAEQHRRRGEAEAALQAYDRAIALYERSAEGSPDTKPNTDHYVAMALAGRARVLLEQNKLEPATATLIAGLARKPEATATMDGLNISPADTARTLKAKLALPEHDALLAQLEAALAQLDPVLLQLPAYESQGPGPGGARGGRGGRRGGR